MSTTAARGPVPRARFVATYAVRLMTSRDARQARRARSHLRALRKISPGFKVIGVADDGGSTWVHASDDVITPIVLSRGHFQRNDFEHCVDLVQRLSPRPSATAFVDVGANVGTTTLYAARTGAFSRIVSVEPSPDNLEVLRLNVTTNGLAEVVEVVAAACGAEAGQVQLMLSTVSAGDHRVRRTDEVPTTHQTLVDVAQRPLDEILSSTGVAPEDISFIWVDTQGHEPSVLAGAEATIAAGVPFVVEFWPEQYLQAGTLDAVIERISSGFRGYVDVREPSEVEHPVHDLRALADHLVTRWHGQTDLVLLPKG